MNFIAPSSDLLQHLLTVNGAIMSKPIIPILENFLFDISDNQLRIYSTDLETSMTTSMQVECKESMKVAVPSKMVIDILRSLPDQPVTFNIDPQTFGIEVVNSNGRYKMAGRDGVDFPLCQKPMPTEALPSLRTFCCVRSVKPFSLRVLMSCV